MIGRKNTENCNTNEPPTPGGKRPVVKGMKTMLTEKQIKTIEEKLNELSERFYASENTNVIDTVSGYAQGIAFVLDKMGYDVKWGKMSKKATIVKEG